MNFHTKCRLSVRVEMADFLQTIANYCKLLGALFPVEMADEKGGIRAKLQFAILRRSHHVA